MRQECSGEEADLIPELRAIEVYVQGKSSDESLGEEAAGLMKEITDLLYSTQVSLRFRLRPGGYRILGFGSGGVLIAR